MTSPNEPTQKVVATLGDRDPTVGGDSVSIETVISPRGLTIVAAMVDGKRHEITLDLSHGVLNASISCSDMGPGSSEGATQLTPLVSVMFGPDRVAAVLRDAAGQSVGGVVQPYAQERTEGLALLAHNEGVSINEMVASIAGEFAEAVERHRADARTYEIRAYATRADYDNDQHIVVASGLEDRSNALHEANRYVGNHEIVVLLSSDGEDCEDTVILAGPGVARPRKRIAPPGATIDGVPLIDVRAALERTRVADALVSPGAYRNPPADTGRRALTQWELRLCEFLCEIQDLHYSVRRQDRQPTDGDYAAIIQMNAQMQHDMRLLPEPENAHLLLWHRATDLSYKISAYDNLLNGQPPTVGDYNALIGMAWKNMQDLATGADRSPLRSSQPKAPVVKSRHVAAPTMSPQ